MKTKKGNKTYILYFNTSKDRELDVFLINANGGGKARNKSKLSHANITKQPKHLNAHVIDRLKQEGDYKVTEYLLKSIEAILMNNKLKPKDLGGIITVTGPGPFTSLRIACVVANTLAFTLKIPVVGIPSKQGLTSDEKFVKLGLTKLKTVKGFKQISPFYGKQPNITNLKN